MTYGATTGEYGLATLCEPVHFIQGQVNGLPCSDGVERRARRQYIALLSEAAPGIGGLMMRTGFRMRARLQNGRQL